MCIIYKLLFLMNRNKYTDIIYMWEKTRSTVIFIEL